MNHANVSLRRGVAIVGKKSAIENPQLMRDQQSLIASTSGAVLTLMNITNLTPQQLRRAVSIREQQIDGLSRELRSLLDGSSASGKKRSMSAAAKRKNCGGAAGEMGEAERSLGANCF